MKIKLETILKHLNITEAECEYRVLECTDELSQVEQYILPSGQIIFCTTNLDREVVWVNGYSLYDIVIGRLCHNENTTSDLLLVMDLGSHDGKPFQTILTWYGDTMSYLNDFEKIFIEDAILEDGESPKYKTELISVIIEYLLKKRGE